MRRYTIYNYTGDTRLKLWPPQKIPWQALVNDIASKLKRPVKDVVEALTKAYRVLFSNGDVYKVTLVRDHLKVVVAFPRKVIYAMVDDPEMLPLDWLGEGYVYAYLSNTDSADYLHAERENIKGLNKVSGYEVGFYTEAYNLAFFEDEVQ